MSEKLDFWPIFHLWASFTVNALKHALTWAIYDLDQAFRDSSQVLGGYGLGIWGPGRAKHWQPELDKSRGRLKQLL